MKYGLGNRAPSAAVGSSPFFTGRVQKRSPQTPVGSRYASALNMVKQGPNLESIHGREEATHFSY
jgi:hypothetical protein